MRNNLSTCPVCGVDIVNYPALSRKDNETEICSTCGQIEALQDLVKREKNVSFNFIQEIANNFGIPVEVLQTHYNDEDGWLKGEMRLHD